MISERSIDLIKQATLSQVTSHYLPDQKKKGVNYQACCPFHGEKTPSLTINDSRGQYKCFGCGVSGDAIKFVMEHEKLTFIEAIEEISKICGIPLEYEESKYTQEQKKQASAKKDATQLQEQVLNIAIPFYHKQLLALPSTHPAKLWLAERCIDADTIAKWQIGWCTEEWKNITPTIIDKGLYTPANKLGIVKTSKDGTNNYDGYRSRIIVPIHDRQGKAIGLAGRYIKINQNDAPEIAKWINTSDCEIYSKTNTLFGLHHAKKAMEKAKKVYVVEGCFDCINPSRMGMENVVATCGTAFTKEQMLLLKKYCNGLVFMFDNDDSGRKEFPVVLKKALPLGLNVDVAIYDGKDPDEYVRNRNRNGIQCIEFPITNDAILHYAKLQMDNAEGDIRATAMAQKDLLSVIALLPEELLRSNYYDSLAKRYKWKNESKKEMMGMAEAQQPVVVDELNSIDPVKFPPYITEKDIQEFEENGFLAIDRKEKGKPMVGYFTFGANGKSEITNFTVTPLFHVYAGQESRYLLQIYNGYRKAILDLPAKNIPSVEAFQGCAVSEGNFLIFGAKAQWLRIASELLGKFPRCTEITTLGWQAHGFFAFVNNIYIPNQPLIALDDWGIFKKENADKSTENFLIPASCQAYSQLQNSGHDPYEHVRYLTYEKSPYTFSQWAAKMYSVYGQKGIVAIAYTILTVFRDLVFEIDNNCPHLYGFGEPSSGKSKWAESMMAVFYKNRAAFNLNSGTDAAFFSYMGLYSNCPAQLNEFEIEVIKQEWFQAIKGIYDGESRQRYKIGSRSSVEIQKVKSTLILTGQKLVTADDNSVVTRSIIEPFSVQDYTDTQKADYDELKGHEGKCFSSMLLEILVHRPEMQENYKNYFNEILGNWRKTKADARQLNQRILQNYCHLATCYSILYQHIALPQSAFEYMDYCFAQATKWSQFIRSSDTLSDFWRTLEYLADSNQIQEGWDYKIISCQAIKIRINKDVVEKKFNEPTKVILIRLNNIHKIYQVAYRSRTGREAMNIENLLHYFSSRKYYLGNVKNVRFRKIEYVNKATANGQFTTEKTEIPQLSSCYAFIYADLGIEIDRFDGVQEPESQITESSTKNLKNPKKSTDEEF